MIHRDFNEYGTLEENEDSGYYVINSLIYARKAIVDMLKHNMDRYLGDTWRKGFACINRVKAETNGMVSFINRKASRYLPKCYQTSHEESVLGDGFQYVTDLFDPLTMEQMHEANVKGW